MTKENDIEKEILIYLGYQRVMVWKVKSVGTYDPIKKIFRKTMPYYRKGVADICGIFKGKPLAIEVKTEVGKLSKVQKEFRDDFTKEGGIYILARCINDVRAVLWPEINKP